MPLTRHTVAVVSLALAFSVTAQAKFGMSKTRVTLNRVRPPDILLVGDTASLDVSSRARSVAERDLDVIRRRVEQGISADRSKRLVEKGGDSVVHVVVEDLEARINNDITYEMKYMKVGERQEYDSKKKAYVTKDVYENRNVAVPVRRVKGRIDAHVEVEQGGRPAKADAGASYENEFKGEVRYPEQASSESSLEDFLVQRSADHAAATVTYSPDPVEALLAVDGELKNGNILAQSGMWREALGKWVDQKPMKGDKEAARMHNIGVAHEALAYALPIDSPEHQKELEEARDSYRKALALDTSEKYFQEPNQRIDVSLGYAASARAYADEVRKWREAHGHRSGAPAPREARRTDAEAPPPPPPVPSAAKPAAPAPPAARPATARPAAPAPKQDTLASSAGLAIPLRNGSFESGLDPWTVAGKGVVASDARRGRVFQAVAAAAATTLSQPVTIDVASAPSATLSLDYKVGAGEGKLRVLVAYDDAAGKPRTSTLEITAGDAPGDWTPWTSDLLALRPKAAHVKEIRIIAEGGTVLLDNVALTVR